jgi:predicted DNA-binding ribbon-helix-helix protein
MRRGLEIGLNVLILAACIAVILGVTYSRLGPGRIPQSAPPIPPKGTKIEISGVEWSNSQRTIVLALSTHCRFCTASGKFYKRLQEVAESRGVPIVAVLPEPTDESKSYLENLHIPIAVVRQSPLAGVHVSATPTLMIVSSEGKVTDSWAGQLSPRLEEEVISKL